MSCVQISLPIQPESLTLFSQNGGIGEVLEQVDGDSSVFESRNSGPVHHLFFGDSDIICNTMRLKVQKRVLPFCTTLVIKGIHLFSIPSCLI